MFLNSHKSFIAFEYISLAFNETRKKTMLLFAIDFLYYFIQNNETSNAKNNFIFKPMRVHTDWVEISQFIKTIGKAYLQGWDS